MLLPRPGLRLEPLSGCGCRVCAVPWFHRRCPDRAAGMEPASRCGLLVRGRLGPGAALLPGRRAWMNAKTQGLSQACRSLPGIICLCSVAVAGGMLSEDRVWAQGYAIEEAAQRMTVAD